ncbi:MAG TPA: SBBP repeat-containing protein [Methylomirabilota bacterium]|nr:SBBP repeat-containing protein [Methylomirabilota bacterium]
MNWTRPFAKLLAVLVVGVSMGAGSTSAASANGPAISGGSSEPRPGTNPRVQALLANLPLYFVENRGQEDPRVAYYVPGRTIATYFTADGVTFAFSSPTPPPPRRAAFVAEPPTRERWALKLDFVGARPVMPRGQDVTPTIFSYFKGPESEWKTGLKTYAGVVYPDLWPGIDLVYGGSAGRLKYAFHVKPGADPAQIRLAYRGATAVVLDRGRLEVSTPLGGFTDDRPYAYQEVDGRRMEIPTRYAKAAGQHAYGFEVGDYDRNRPLVLDPTVIVYAGYIGGTGSDGANAIAVDSAGNAYVAGSTTSTAPSFPGIAGPDLIQNGNNDAFVAKVKADGTGLIYAGYIGGAGEDFANAIAVNSVGNAYVAGGTTSDQATFPVKMGPRLTYSGNQDAFVAKVKADGTGLVYAGYIGGADLDRANAIALDSAGNAYVAGLTASTEATFPVTMGPPHDTYHGGTFDAFVAKVKADGTALVYAGYIGGAGDDEATAVKVDAAGNAYVAGFTDSDQNTFPVRVGPDLTYNGHVDGFVAKVKADGTGLVYAGYIGGAEDDFANAIAVDSAGNAYVAGSTNSHQATFPVKVGPSLTYNGPDCSSGSDSEFCFAKSDAFVAKVKADGTGLVYAGYIGGAAGDAAFAIAVDSAGNAYVAGDTGSDQTSFPVKVGPDLTFSGGCLSDHTVGCAVDAFVAKVKADGTGLIYAGYIGGAGPDFASAIAVDPAGNAYVAGSTGSDQTSFPVTVGPDLMFNGDADAFVVKLSGKPDLAETAVSNPPRDLPPGASFSVSDTVENRGLGDAPASTTRYRLLSTSLNVLLTGNRSVPALVPGATNSGSATVTIPSSIALGTYQLLACADDSRAVAETDDTNNCAASSASVRVSRPDLQETSVSNPPATLNAGQGFSVSDTVSNFGSVAAPASTTRYYLSLDTARNSGDILLTGSRAIGLLGAGADPTFSSTPSTSSGTVTVTTPSTTPGGTYHVLACADDTRVVTETNENNNCLASTGTVTVSSTGTFELSPTAATVLPDELVLYRFRWITPTVWQDLATLELRFVGQSDGKIIFWARWDQASNTFVLLDIDGTPTGRAVAPGSTEILQTGNAVLHLDQTTVVPGGPTAPDVTLTLAMTFKSEAAGQDYLDYRVEVRATDDGGRQQGFTQAGTLRVERTAAAAATLQGSATAVGAGTDSASIRLQAQFTATDAVSLDQATLTLEALLDEVGGAGELVKGGGGAVLLPLLLTARAGGKPTDAIYQTPSGVRPVVWAEVKIRDPKTGLMEAYIKLDRATIPIGPASCAGSPATTRLRTSFSVQSNGGAPVGVDLTLPWRCLGTELKTP